MFEFMISRAETGFLIESDAAAGDAFAKRLTLYKLRARVSIARLDTAVITVSWDAPRRPTPYAICGSPKPGWTLPRGWRCRRLAALA
jgi:folate-binding Fe-S cluster repair protein YgfZ